jgi:K+-sensing histidine kinase KdpD
VDSVMQKGNSTWLWIGLALSQNIVEEFDSHIHLKSNKKQGSNFYFDIALMKE